MAKRSKHINTSKAEKVVPDESLFAELSQLIEQSRQQVAMVANSSLTVLFWQVGKRINEEILGNERADYGKKIVSTLSIQLENSYGRNFTEKNLRRMMQFAELFPDFQIVVPLARQLSWSHFITIIPLKTNEERLFYANLAINGMLGKRELRKQIASKTFERTSIANTQAAQIDKGIINTFKDPYIWIFSNSKTAIWKKILKL